MESNATRVHDPRQATFKDGLGTRYRRDGQDGPVDVLVLRDAFAPIPSFEFLLRERLNRLAHVRSEHIARVYDVEHVTEGAKLAVVSKAVPGVRLSRMLAVAEQNLLPLDTDSALCLIHQLLIGMSDLHDDAPDACHGTLSAERVVVTGASHVTIVEHVLGAALAQLRHSPERYWKELRIAMPIAVNAPLLDRRADVAQIGVIALALLLGRPIADDEFPSDIAGLANGSFGLGGNFEPFPDWLRAWLSQALSLEPTRWFASAVEARQSFEAGIKTGSYTASQEKLTAFLREYSRFDDLEIVRATPIATSAPAAPRTPIAVAVPKLEVAPSAAKAAPTPAAAPAATKAEPKLAAPASQPFAAKAAPTEPTPAPVAAKAPAPEPIRLPQPTVRFGSDEEADMPQMYGSQGNARTSSHRGRIIAAAVVVLALMSGGVMAARRYLSSSPATPATTTGTLVVNTDPAGAAVVIDGQSKGTTPVSLSVSAGPHTLELSNGGGRRTMTVNVTANAQVSQFIEMPKASAGTGELTVRTDPAGAKVSVDGQPRGVTPITVGGLTPGSHDIQLTNDLGSVNEDVTIQAGATASLVVPMKAPQGAPLSGWITINAPAELQIFENQRLLGSSRSDRIMVAAGRHEIEFQNDALGFRGTQTINVPPGQTARLRPDWPQGTIAINATPWATVTLDGQDLGETPVGNTQVPIGTHELVFRHPQLGEQRMTATVTATAPARLSVDMRKK